MSAKAIAQFVATVSAVFPSPRHDHDDDARVWLALYSKALERFDAAAIIKAAEHIAMTRSRKKDGAYFPEPSECIAACEKAAESIRLRELSKNLLTVDKAPKAFCPDRHKLAMDFLSTPLGLEAVRERWHGALYDFAYRNQRTPAPAEVAAVKAASAAFIADVERCERGEVEAATDLDIRALGRLGRGIINRREKHARAIEGNS